MFTAAQHVAHAARTVEWFFNGAFCPDGFRMEWEQMDREVRAVQSLAAARQWLERAFASGRAAILARSAAEWEAQPPPGRILGGLPRFTILGAIHDHMAHQRGALAVHARLPGKVPPMPCAETPEA